MNYLVGLTGGIGSGKSTVANMFADLGIRVIDTDLISHQLTQTDGAAISALRETFGAQFIDAQGALDRVRMRDLVFNNPAEKKQLEAILHPLIFSQTKQQTASATDAPYTLVVVPLLYESGRYVDWLHRVVTVDCPEEIQIARTVQRSNMKEGTVRAIMAQQLSRRERLTLSDDVIVNCGGLDDLKKQVTEMHHRLCALAFKSD